MKPTILIIEDDPIAAHLLELTLKRKGFQALVAFDGLQGLAITRSQPVDLILLDLMLPGLDGFEVLNRLRDDQRTADLPVVVISAKTRPADKRAAAKVGADAYLTKPYETGQALELIGSLLREKREQTTAQGPCAIVAGSHTRETIRTALRVGSALQDRGEKITLVNLHPISDERSMLSGMPRRKSPLSLADPETAGQLAELAVQHPGGLRVLEGVEGRGKAGRITSRGIDALLEALLSEDAFVLLCLPSDYPTDVLCRAATRCSGVLLVARSDPDSLGGAGAVLTVLARDGVDEDRVGMVVVGPTAEKMRLQLDRKILCSLPIDASDDHPAFHELADWLRDVT